MANMLDALKEAFSKNDSHRKVKQAIPVRPEWQALYEEMTALAKEADLAKNKLNTARKFFWSSIERDLGVYNDMRFNSEKNEIEILEDEDCE